MRALITFNPLSQTNTEYISHIMRITYGSPLARKSHPTDMCSSGLPTTNTVPHTKLGDCRVKRGWANLGAEVSAHGFKTQRQLGPPGISESPAPLSKGTRVGVAQAKPHDPTLVSAKIEESCQGETQQGRLSKTGPNPTIPAYMRTQHRHTPRERIRHRVQKESSRSLPRNPCSCETHHIVARGYATTQQGDRTKHSTALLPFALSARQLRATPYTCFLCDTVAVIRDDFHSVSGYCVALRYYFHKFFAYMRTQHRHMPRERIRHRVQKESSRSLPRNPCSCETHHLIARGYSTTHQGDRTKRSTALLPFALSVRQP
jgi:hypothetical protein